MAHLLSTLARCRRGAMAIETALVAPILCLLALGTYDVSALVSRQQELQSAANEASTIVLAAANSTGISSADMKTIIKSSLNLTDSQVTIDLEYRCDAATTRTTTLADCDVSKPIYSYVKLTLTDSYTPLWTSFGVGGTMNYSVTRTVQMS